MCYADIDLNLLDAVLVSNNKKGLVTDINISEEEASGYKYTIKEIVCKIKDDESEVKK